MGQLLGFYAGDADAIGAAYEDDSDSLADEDFVRAHADFSLHVTPLDIDFLVEAIAERTGGTARPLEESFTRLVGGDPEERSAHVVDPTWVQLVAGADGKQASDLAAEWIKRVGAEYRETLEVSPEAVQAVGELIRLCQLAAKEKLDVVFTWSL
jgi:hypothetical protein